MKKWVANSLIVMRKFGVMVIGLGGLLSAVAWLSGMFEEKIGPSVAQPTHSRGEPLVTEEVHLVTKSYIEEAVGTLKSSSRTVVSSKVLATVSSIFVTAGDTVETGKLLVELDAAEYVARLNQAQLALRAAEASRAEAEKQFSRAKQLIEQNALSQAEFDQASRVFQVATAEELRFRQAVTEAEVLLSYVTIKATKPGRIVDRFVEPGDVVQPGQSLLAMYDPNALRLEAPVMEDLAVKLSVGDMLEVRIDALNQSFQATVEEIVPQAEALSRTFLVKVKLPESSKLYEGMFGRLLIPAGDREHVCLNTAAIVRVGQLEFVDVVTSAGAVERRLVKTGRLGMPGRQEVLSGLEPGDKVVLHVGESLEELSYE